MKNKILSYIVIFFIVLFVILGILKTPTAKKSAASPTPHPTKTVQTIKPTSAPDASESVKPTEMKQTETYIGNIKTKKFHSQACYSLPSQKNRVEFSSREKAINSGYSPCGNCSP